MFDSRPAIILKLDDVTHENADAGQPVCRAWQRCVDALRSLAVPAALGVIGHSLEGENSAYFDWIRALADEGNVEFWNHGYACRSEADPIGEFERSLPEQIAALKRTQQLGREKLGLTFQTFGPHWSRTTPQTPQALAAVPELRVIFADPASAGDGQVVLPRRLELERPIFRPDADALLRDVDATMGRYDCLTLQGHPPAWDEADLQQFVRAITGLLWRGCRFTTPMRYVSGQWTSGRPRVSASLV